MPFSNRLNALFGRSTDTGPYTPPQGIPSPEGEHTLVLYKYDSCPYCMRVSRAMAGLDVDVELRDTRHDPTARSELMALTGRGQVPCLVIDGVALFESADIVRWLNAHAESNASA